MHVAALIILALAVGSLSAADQARTVPDPYGLGERLALIDYLHAHRVAVPDAAPIEQLRAMYDKIVGAPATFATTEEELKASAAHEEERRQIYRAKLIRDYGLQIPEGATIADLTTIEATESAKKAKADKEAAEKAYAAQREAQEAADRRVGVVPVRGHGPLPGHDIHGGTLVAFLLERQIHPEESNIGSLGKFVYQISNLAGDQVHEDLAILVSSESIAAHPGSMRMYLTEVERLDVRLLNGFSVKAPVYRISTDVQDLPKP